MTSSTLQSVERLERAGRLLSSAGFAGSFALTPLQGGANSKVFRVDLAAGASSLLFKEYFHHPDDLRDRLGTEFAFTGFAWNQGLRMVAQPYALDRAGHCALYAFLEGRKLESGEIDADAIAQCWQFFHALNASKTSPAAARLPVASEACFSPTDHWRCLERRVQRLGSMSSDNSLDAQVLAFVRQELAPASAAYLARARAKAAALCLDVSASIPAVDRCLSPSDFGFHNALRSGAGTLRFLDFEYAGWDDPAKAVCDFFCQPACPAPFEYYAEVAGQVAATTSDPALHRNRIALLLPMYRLKWCCIMLNDFLPGDGSRRRFAHFGGDESARKTTQFHKARQALQRFHQEGCSALAA